jgi:hypothetical protein
MIVNGMKAKSVVKTSAAALTGTSFTVKLKAANTSTRKSLTNRVAVFTAPGVSSAARARRFQKREFSFSTERITAEAFFKGGGLGECGKSGLEGVIFCDIQGMLLVRSLKITYSLAALIALPPLAPIHAAAPPAPKFYPGVSEFQSMRAHDALRAFYNGNLPRAERLLRELDTHEDSEELPPLSRLLMTAMYGLTLQRDDAITLQDRNRIRVSFDSAADKGLSTCAEPPQEAQATCLLIEGGIRGFRAILDLNTRGPTDVLSEGLAAVDLLEKALQTDSLVRDAHLGLGIFNAMAASNTPRVVRGMLRAAGRGVSLPEGLSHLRRSGYEGQYTSVASQFFLIRFLSPYDMELRREKIEIFRSLQGTFPLSPLVPFLQNHEALVFYPDSFYRPRARILLARTIRAVETRDEAGRRYLQLLKYQYTLLNNDPAPQYRPDSTFDLGGYGFYPDFIEALRLRQEVLGVGAEGPLSEVNRRRTEGSGLDGSRDLKADAGLNRDETLEAAERLDKVKRIAAYRKDILSRLRKTDKALLNPQNRGLLEWHVGDALRPDQFKPKVNESPETGTRGKGGPSGAVAGQSHDDTAETTSKAAGKSRKPPER